jgi:alkylation response protein AidB-like acyl-CoA dehydrogenase
LYLALSDEQEFLADAAAGILARESTLAAAREALDTRVAPPLWEVATGAGWPGLLIGEDADGAGLGLYDALLVLEACGAVLADARLLGHLPACGLLESANAEIGLRRSLASGEQRAALVDGLLGYRGAPLRARPDGDAVQLDGTVRGVLDAPGADVLVVIGIDPAGDPVAAVVEDAPDTAAVQPAPSYDATRSLGVVRLDGVRATRLELDGRQVAEGRSLQRALLAAESVGAADACLKMAREYAIDRHAFGRAIGSYQAIKHKLVEMLRRIESARSLVRYAGDAWELERAELGLAANAARVVSTDALDYAAPENIFIHGGVGATWEHDAQLYYRRAEVARRLGGGAEAAADAVADELFARSGFREGLYGGGR